MWFSFIVSNHSTRIIDCSLNIDRGRWFDHTPLRINCNKKRLSVRPCVSAWSLKQNHFLTQKKSEKQKFEDYDYFLLFQTQKKYVCRANLKSHQQKFNGIKKLNTCTHVHKIKETIFELSQQTVNNKKPKRRNIIRLHWKITFSNVDVSVFLEWFKKQATASKILENKV